MYTNAEILSLKAYRLCRADQELNCQVNCGNAIKLEFYIPVFLSQSIILHRTLFHFYSAMHIVARYCQGKLSACLSVTLRYRDHIGWNSAKIISRLISLTISLSAHPNMTDLYCKWNTPNFSRNRSGVRKNVDFRHLSRRISETVQDI